MLGKSPIKWRQRPDMTIAVDWDVKHQFKQTNNLIQLYVPFKIISYETDQSVGGRKRENPEKKTPETPVSRTWLVSHVASAGL